MMRINWDFFRVHVMGQFRALKEFHSHSEAQLQESCCTLRTIGGEVVIPPGADDHEVQGLLSEHFDEIDEIDQQCRHVRARLLRHSVLVMCFALVESNLSRISGEIVNRKQLPLSLKELQAKDLVKRFQKFWTKVADLSWWDDHDKWNLLKDVEQMRHIIVHRYGVVRENERRRGQILAHDGVCLLKTNDENIDPDDVGTLVVEDQFCEMAIDSMTSLMREVFDRADCFGPENLVIE